MSAFIPFPSPRLESEAIYDHIVPAGTHWLHEIKQGQFFRIVDLEGNQAADTLFYNAHDPLDRYSPFPWRGQPVTLAPRSLIRKGTPRSGPCGRPAAMDSRTVGSCGKPN